MDIDWATTGQLWTAVGQWLAACIAVVAAVVAGRHARHARRQACAAEREARAAEKHAEVAKDTLAHSERETRLRVVAEKVQAIVVQAREVERGKYPKREDEMRLGLLRKLHDIARSTEGDEQLRDLVIWVHGEAIVKLCDDYKGIFGRRGDADMCERVERFAEECRAYQEP